VVVEVTAEVYAFWAFVVYLAVWFALAITTWRFRKRLWIVSPKLAAKYAKPLFETNIVESWAAGAFVLRQKYRCIGDRRLNRLGDWTCSLFWTMAALLVVFIGMEILAAQGY
jgi:hypothetical protein